MVKVFKYSLTNKFSMKQSVFFVSFKKKITKKSSLSHSIKFKTLNFTINKIHLFHFNPLGSDFRVEQVSLLLASLLNVGGFIRHRFGFFVIFHHILLLIGQGRVERVVGVLTFGTFRRGLVVGGVEGVVLFLLGLGGQRLGHFYLYGRFLERVFPRAVGRHR